MYIDDAFSWDFTCRITFYPPYRRLLPDKQARLLTLFDELGIPHDERKQVSGSPLQIISFVVDPNTMTISMPLKAQAELVAAIRTFATPGQRRSLRDFQRLAGCIGKPKHFSRDLIRARASSYKAKKGQKVEK